MSNPVPPSESSLTEPRTEKSVSVSAWAPLQRVPGQSNRKMLRVFAFSLAASIVASGCLLAVIQLLRSHQVTPTEVKLAIAGMGISLSFMGSKWTLRSLRREVQLPPPDSPHWNAAVCLSVDGNIYGRSGGRLSVEHDLLKFEGDRFSFRLSPDQAVVSAIDSGGADIRLASTLAPVQISIWPIKNGHPFSVEVPTLIAPWKDAVASLESKTLLPPLSPDPSGRFDRGFWVTFAIFLSVPFGIIAGWSFADWLGLQAAGPAFAIACVALPLGVWVTQKPHRDAAFDRMRTASTHFEVES